MGIWTRALGRAALTMTVVACALTGTPAAHAEAPKQCQGHRATIVGTDGPELLKGTQGRDVVWAGAGDDKIATSGGDDLVCAGPGDDFVRAGNGADTVLGEGGEDDLETGNGFDDDLSGGAGDDVLDGAGEDAVLHGGDGDDQLTANAKGVVLDGGADEDQLLARSASVVSSGGSGDDVIDGFNARDAGIDGGPGDDRIAARGGSDGSGDAPVRGGSGDDMILGQAGRDVLDGGPGDDTVQGGDAADQVHGGTGDDTLAGDGGDDFLFGEVGIDTCSGGEGYDDCDGGPVGTDAPSSEDPDICQPDVEIKHNCYGEYVPWSGTASGTLTYSGGVLETWTATYAMDVVTPDYLWGGDAHLTWSVRGTDSQGCVYDGKADLDGRAELTIFDGLYYVELRNSTRGVQVDVDCPDSPPTTETFQPLNTDFAQVDDVPLPPDPYTTLSGTASYEPTDAPEGQVDWSWSMTKGQ